ncbi:MAG TPA: pyridoxal phosphate-dependent aminotransferase [Candidatus Acidoferrales bacterium]|nr:pyridoxal phosphate-dependent aminotransferase [Candidatus Acidoferrales bacterium]
MKLSERSKAIKPSVTLAVTAKAQAMRARGVDLVSFAAGEPDFDTPEHIKEAAVRALEKGMTKYTDVRGVEPLRAAIAEKYRREYGLEFTPDEVIVSCGGKHALYNVLQAVIDPGDEVVIPAPYWVSYSDMVLLCGGVPRIVPTTEENGFRLTPEQLEKNVSAKTRAFILNSPCNPTGAAYDRAALEGLARVLERHDCLLISDDIYEKIVYDGFQFHTMLALAPKLRERTVILNAVSKTYSMTGWRIGYALGPRAIISAAGTIQSQSTSNPTSFAQAAALEAITGPQDCVEAMAREFQKRRDLLVERLNAMDGVQCLKPQGAFYVFPNVRGLLGKKAGEVTIDSPCALAEFFLEKAQVALVPGEDFGSKENVRLTYSTALADIEKGCDRIEAAIKQLV